MFFVDRYLEAGSPLASVVGHDYPPRVVFWVEQESMLYRMCMVFTGNDVGRR